NEPVAVKSINAARWDRFPTSELVQGPINPWRIVGRIDCVDHEVITRGVSSLNDEVRNQITFDVKDKSVCGPQEGVVVTAFPAPLKGPQLLRDHGFLMPTRSGCEQNVKIIECREHANQSHREKQNSQD